MLCALACNADSPHVHMYALCRTHLLIHLSQRYYLKKVEICLRVFVWKKLLMNLHQSFYDIVCGQMENLFTRQLSNIPVSPVKENCMIYIGADGMPLTMRMN